MALDLTPLRDEPTAEQRAELRRRAKAGEFGPTTSQLVGSILVGTILTVFVIVALGMLRFSTVFPDGAPSSGEGLFRFARYFPYLWSGLVGLFVVTFVVGAVRGVITRHDWYRLALFAQANGLSFARSSADPGYPGLLFARGDNRRTVDHVWSRDGLLADAGTYTYTTGSGEDRETHTWSYVAFRLPRSMPHLLLDAKANKTSLADFKRDQRVSLGQPVDDHYTLWAPAGYGQDAFQIFPPDLLEQLVASPVPYDIEIVDRWLFLYSSGSVDLTKAENWETIEQIQDQIVTRVARSSERYLDRRPGGAGAIATFTGDPGRPVPVAEEGRRLRTSWVRSAASIGLMVALAFIWHVYLRPLLFP